jgi:hypothetical protein
MLPIGADVEMLEKIRAERRQNTAPVQSAFFIPATAR